MSARASTETATGDARLEVSVVGHSRARRGWTDVTAIVLVLLVVIAVWELAPRRGWISPVMLPPATEVMFALRELATAPWFPAHVATTALETVLGFILAAVIAIGLATVMHLSPAVRRVLYPYAIAFKLVPAVVLAPVFVVWFGFGIAPKVLVAASIAFFVIFVSTLAGFDSVGDDWRRLMRALGASRLQLFRMVVLRSALPYIFAGMRTGITLALVGALVAEFIQSRRGLGSLLIEFGYAFQQDFLFATIVVVTLMGLVFFAAIVAVERRMLWWR